MKAFGISLVVAALLLHSYCIYWTEYGPRPRMDSSALAFFCGFFIPVLMIGAGIGMAIRRPRQ